MKMQPIKFSSGIVKLRPELFDYIQENIISSFIYYIINSRKREAVRLSVWLQKQIETPAESIISIVSAIPNGEDYDEQVFLVMRWIQNHIRYIGDFTQWNTSEVWSEAGTTSDSLKGDCEDGAILIYVLSRLKGVPANRLLIWTGEVQASVTAPTGGHACLFYKSINFPLNFVNLDWCYFPSTIKVGERSLFEFYNKEVTEYVLPNYVKNVWNKYRNTWFLFNENVAYSKYLLKPLTER